MYQSSYHNTTSAPPRKAKERSVKCGKQENYILHLFKGSPLKDNTGWTACDMNKVKTKGDVYVQDIEVGHLHYESEYGETILVQVLTKPVCVDGYWTWESKDLFSGRIITYGVREGYSHYGPNLYNKR